MQYRPTLTGARKWRLVGAEAINETFDVTHPKYRRYEPSDWRSLRNNYIALALRAKFRVGSLYICAFDVGILNKQPVMPVRDYCEAVEFFTGVPVRLEYVTNHYLSN